MKMSVHGHQQPCSGWLKYLLQGAFACLLTCCGRESRAPEAWSSLSETSRDEVVAPNLSLHDKISRYPAVDSFGLIDNRFLWMQRIELVAGLHFLEDKIKDAPIIAILDSGIDYLHPALQQNVFQKPEGIASHCEDDTHGCDTSNYQTGTKTLGNGHVYPVGTKGPDQNCLSQQGTVPSMECSHGTHVAGVIAGFNEEQSIFGLCPHCRILPIKVVGSDGTISDQAIIGALQYIAELRRAGVPIRIVNSSFGKFLSSKKVAAAIESLPQFKDDILIVAAAGNENTWLRTYPASFANVIAVANVNSSDLKKDGKSNFGHWVDIAAPVGNCYPGLTSNSGYGVVSAVPGDASRCANGTSVAAPEVTAVAGLILSMEPTLSIAQLRERIIRGADADLLYGSNPDYLQTEQGERLPLLGAGLLNVNNALRGTKSGLVLYNKEHHRIASPLCGTLTASSGRHNQALLFITVFLPLCLPIVRRRRCI